MKISVEGSLDSIRSFPKMIRPVDEKTLKHLQGMASKTRWFYESRKTPYHDNKMAHWIQRNPDVLKDLHHSNDLLEMAESIFEKKLKPSLNSLVLYGPKGSLFEHVDAPIYQFTIDLLINSDDKWPLYIESKPYVMAPGEALCFLGTEQPHFRKPMALDSNATFCDLALFSFVPVDWTGSLNQGHTS